MKLRDLALRLLLQNLLHWIFLAALLIAASVFFLMLFPVLIAFCFWWHLAERRFISRLQRAGRRQSWARTRASLASRQGTLIVEVECEIVQIRRAWWLPAHLLKLFPAAPWTKVEDLRRMQVAGEALLEPAPACREWCDQALPRLAHAAVLVDFTPELLWMYLNSPSCAAHCVAVAPYPALTYSIKRSMKEA